jgi:hypothetical protein
MATDFQGTAGLLRRAFVDNWVARVPNVQVAYRNGPKLDPIPDAEAGHDWVRFSILDGFAIHPNVGSRRRRTTARVEIQIFTPLGRGDGRSRELGDTVADIWDDVARTGTVPGVTLGAPEFVAGGPDDSTPFWVDVVSTPFRIDHLPS